jgi:DNA-binding transcriptional regulator GbsR (MarR family)
MKTEANVALEARMRLVEEGGRAAQDLGVGRIPGQILVYLYLSDGERSLDQIEADLGLSKAAASGATRQLEGFGFLKRVWRQGDRRVYFRTADNLGEVFREGVVAMVRRKVESVASELERTTQLMEEAEQADDPEIRFLSNRIKRAKDLSDRANKILNSRILRYLSR